MHLVLVVLVVVLVLQSKGLYCLHLTTKSPGKSRHFRLQVCRPSPPPPSSPLLFVVKVASKLTKKQNIFVTLFPYLILFENM